MTNAKRSCLLGLILLATGALSIAQAPKTDTPVTQSAEKAAADKAAADKAAADKAAADKAAVDRAAAASNPLSLNNDQIYQKSLAALTMAFVIAVLLESAFSVIFNWRVFLAYFSLRGVKTIIMVAISWLIVNAFGVDVMASLIAAYKSPPPPSAPVDAASISRTVSRFVTALILAGGSAGVNRIMVALGFRSNSREEEVAPRPPSDKAWVAVLVTRVKAVSEVVVMIKEIGPVDASSPIPIAGMVGFKRTGLASLIFRSTNRFPPNGGHTVSPNVVYLIKVEAKDAQGSTISALNDRNYVFAPGAIVDFAVKL